jgi:hypothetical protein
MRSTAALSGFHPRGTTGKMHGPLGPFFRFWRPRVSDLVAKTAIDRRLAAIVAR